MGRASRASFFAILLVVLQPLASMAAAGHFRYQRDLSVEAPGWVKTRLPVDLLMRLDADEGDLRLTDPAGAPLPLFPWRPPEDPPPRLQVAELVDLREAPGGWWVRADLGDPPGRHRMLILDVPGEGLAQDVILEGSPGGEEWGILARGSLFRLHRWGMTARTFLEYPPSTARHLRIFWPAAAGRPRWKAVRVADWPEDRTQRIQEPLSHRSAWTLPGEAAYRVEAPRTPLQGAELVLDLELSFPLRARILTAGQGTWTQAVESVLVPDRPARLPVPARVFGSALLLVLEAGGYDPPALTELRVEYEPRYVLFKAPRAGPYRLSYGALGQAGPPGVLQELPELPEAPREVELQAEFERDPPDLPAPSLAMGAILPEGGFSARWKLQEPAAGPRDLVVLDLPGGVYGSARPDLADLRISYQAKQVPYVLWSPPEGTQVLRIQGTSPTAADKPGSSMLELDLPEEGLPLTVLDLAAPSAPFTRAVRLEYPRKARPEEGIRGEIWEPLARATWHCPGVSSSPARLRLEARRVEARRLRIVFQDGDNAPLPSVDVTLWRKAHRLLFPWPGREEVALLAGAPELRAPRYDLASIKEEIIRRPATPVEVDARLEGIRRPGLLPEPYGTWLLVGALLLAAALLLAILVRALRAPGAGGSGKDGP